MKVLLFLIFLIPSMAFGSRFTTVPVISANPMTSTVNSYGIDVNQLALASFQAAWTCSACAGTFTIQVSNDNVPMGTGNDPAANVINWVTYTGSSTAISGTGNLLYNMSFAGYRWARMVYTFASGSGTLNAQFSGKGFTN